MVDVKKKKYSQEDVENMLWEFYLKDKEASQRDALCTLLEKHNVDNIVEVNKKLFDFYNLGEEHRKYVEAVEFLRKEYNLDVR
jgi:hypothetical protein